MKNTIKLLTIVLAVMLVFACSKAEKPTATTQPETAVTEEQSSEKEQTTEVSENTSSAETQEVNQDEVEKPWLSLIENEVEEISFKDGECKMTPTNDDEYLSVHTDLGNGLRFYARLKPKDSKEFDIGDDGDADFFQEYVTVPVLSASSLPEYLGDGKWAVEINGYKFAKRFWFAMFSSDTYLFKLSYETTTPKYTLQCTFKRNSCNEFPEEAPQYFENGRWVKHTEFAENLVAGTVESKTAKELYRVSQEFMKTIQIKTKEEKPTATNN